MLFFVFDAVFDFLCMMFLFVCCAGFWFYAVSCVFLCLWLRGRLVSAPVYSSEASDVYKGQALSAPLTRGSMYRVGPDIVQTFLCRRLTERQF